MQLKIQNCAKCPKLYYELTAFVWIPGQILSVHCNAVFNIIATSHLLLAVKATYMIFRIVLYIVNTLSRNTNSLCKYCILQEVNQGFQTV